jgi:hypothetical protein
MFFTLQTLVKGHSYDVLVMGVGCYESMYWKFFVGNALLRVLHFNWLRDHICNYKLQIGQDELSILKFVKHHVKKKYYHT